MKIEKEVKEIKLLLDKLQDLGWFKEKTPRYYPKPMNSKIEEILEKFNEQFPIICECGEEKCSMSRPSTEKFLKSSLIEYGEEVEEKVRKEFGENSEKVYAYRLEAERKSLLEKLEKMVKTGTPYMFPKTEKRFLEDVKNLLK